MPGKAGDPGVTAADNRRFLNAVFWIAKTGAPWRDLPPRFGPWNSVFQRFNRWAKKGVWQQVAETLADDLNLEWLMIDSTIVRAYQHAAGKKEQEGEQLGRSKDGFSTKVHVAVGSHGNPVRFVLTPDRQPT